MTHYEVLGIGRDADAATIKDAYRRLIKDVHPDRNRSPSAEEDAKRVIEAYRTLHAPETRRTYDQTLKPPGADNRSHPDAAHRPWRNRGGPRHGKPHPEAERTRQEQTRTHAGSAGQAGPRPGERRSGDDRQRNGKVDPGWRNLNHYDLLRVPRSADPDAIHAAYVQRVLEARGLESLLQRLGEAHAVLTDPHRRASYDRKLAQGRADESRSRAGAWSSSGRGGTEGGRRASGTGADTGRDGRSDGSTFAEGRLVRHRTLGLGRVVRRRGPDMVVVRFLTGHEVSVRTSDLAPVAAGETRREAPRSAAGSHAGGASDRTGPSHRRANEEPRETRNRHEEPARTRFTSGDAVRHADFGSGVVKSAMRLAAEEIVTVEFGLDQRVVSGSALRKW